MTGNCVEVMSKGALARKIKKTQALCRVPMLIAPLDVYSKAYKLLVMSSTTSAITASTNNIKQLNMPQQLVYYDCQNQVQLY